MCECLCVRDRKIRKGGKAHREKEGRGAGERLEEGNDEQAVELPTKGDNYYIVLPHIKKMTVENLPPSSSLFSSLSISLMGARLGITSLTERGLDQHYVLFFT